jgi:hypothetical protein
MSAAPLQTQDYWRVNSYGYPNPFIQESKSQEAWLTFKPSTRLLFEEFYASCPRAACIGRLWRISDTSCFWSGPMMRIRQYARLQVGSMP